MYMRCVVWVAWVWRGYDLNSKFTPDQSWLNPNQTDPVYAKKTLTRGFQKGATSCFRSDFKFGFEYTQF